LLGGKIAQLWGWRDAFFIVGLPGLILAILIKLTVKEPPRGGYEAVASDAPVPSLGAVLKKLFAAKSFPHLAAGATLGSMGGYGIAFFAVPFLLRGPFHLDIAQAGAAYGIVGGLAAAVGVFLGGAITDLIGKMSRTGYAVIPGLGFLACSPLYVWAFQQGDLATLASFIIAPLILQYLYLGPTFALTHNLVEPRMRATATALLFLPINLIGLGAGPPLVGWLSDVIAERHFTHDGSFKLLCPGGHAAKGAEAALTAACHAASFDGVKWAIILVAGVIFAWAGLHYLLAARTVKRDLVAAEA
jgi:predicted MFS family arabinose efflux permease